MLNVLYNMVNLILQKSFRVFFIQVNVLIELNLKKKEKKRINAGISVMNSELLFLPKLKKLFIPS